MLNDLQYNAHDLDNSSIYLKKQNKQIYRDQAKLIGGIYYARPMLP